MSTHALAPTYAALADDLVDRLPGDLGGELRVGTDVQEIAAVEEALRQHGERYLARVFTEHEIGCVGLPQVSAAQAAPGLAARYAAKEAVIKVLRPRDAGVPWTEIELRRHDSGWCSIDLSGTTRDLAASLGLSHWEASFAHDAGVAVATVVARSLPDTHRHD